MSCLAYVMETFVTSTKTTASLRRYDLDWLRVIAFTLLIFFHTALFFSHWEWFLKNNVVSYSLNYPLVFLIQWRMPLLFIISGAGVYWSLGKRSVETFIKDRTRRILLPLFFGMLVIIPPQIYLERISGGQTYSYVEFYSTLFSSGFYPEGNLGWHHLWYLGYLFVYSLVALPFCLALRTPDGKRLTAQWAVLFEKPIWFIGLPIAWLLLGEFLNLPENERGLINDWKTHYRYFTLFSFGYVFCSQPLFWRTFSRYRLLTLGMASTMTVVLLLVYWRNWHEFTELEILVFTVLRVANYWCWLLAICGFGYKYLNFNNAFLQYASGAVYPFYILHQTLIIILGYYLAPVDWPWQVKFVLLIAGTFGGCFLLYHFLIRPFRLIRPLFGVR